MDIEKKSIQLGRGFLHIENINGGVVNINCHDNKPMNIPSQNLKRYVRRHVKNEVSKFSSRYKNLLEYKLKKTNLRQTKFELLFEEFIKRSPVVTNPEDAAQSGLLHFQESRGQRPGQLVDLSRNRHSREHSHPLTSLHETSRKTQYDANSYHSNCTVIPQKTCDETFNIEHTIGTKRGGSHTDRTESARDSRLFSSESTSCSILKPSESENLPTQDVFNPLDLRSDESHETVSELKLHEPNICSPDCTSTKSFLQLAKTCASRQEQSFSSSYPINDSALLSRKISSSNFCSENTCSEETEDFQTQNEDDILASSNAGIEENENNRNEKFTCKSCSVCLNANAQECFNAACEVDIKSSESEETNLIDMSACGLDSHLISKTCQNECIDNAISSLNEIGKNSENPISTEEQCQQIKDAKNVDNQETLVPSECGSKQRDDPKSEMKSEEILEQNFSLLDTRTRMQKDCVSYLIPCNTVRECSSGVVMGQYFSMDTYIMNENEKSSDKDSVSEGKETVVCKSSSKIPKASDCQNEIKDVTECTLGVQLSNEAMPILFAKAVNVLFDGACESSNNEDTYEKQHSNYPLSVDLFTEKPKSRSVSLPTFIYTRDANLLTKRVRTSSSSSDLGNDSGFDSFHRKRYEDVQTSLKDEPHKGTTEKILWNVLEHKSAIDTLNLVNYCFRASQPVIIKPNNDEQKIRKAFMDVKPSVGATSNYESAKYSDSGFESNTLQDENILHNFCTQTDKSNESDIKSLFSSTVCEINKNGRSEIDRDNETEPEQESVVAARPDSNDDIQVLPSNTIPLHENQVDCDDRYWQRHTDNKHSKPSTNNEKSKQQITYKKKKTKKKCKRLCQKKRSNSNVHPETFSLMENISSTSSSDSSSSWIGLPVTRRHIYPRRKKQTPSFNSEKRTDEKKLVSGEVYLTNKDSGMGSSLHALLSCSTNDFFKLSSFKTSVSALDTPLLATKVISHKSIKNSSQFLSRKKPASQTKTADKKKSRDPLKFTLSSSSKSQMRRRHHKQIRNFFDDIKSQTLKSMVSELHIERTDIQVFGLGSYFDRLNRGEPLSDRDRMQYEWLRLASFQHYTGNGNTLSLARNGFYHDPTDGPTSTRCYLCETRHSTWEYFDNVEAEHRRQSPNCPFHANRNEESTNVSISYEASSQPPKVPPASTPSVNSTIPSSVTQAAPGIASSATGSVTLAVREATRNMAQTQISSQNDEVRVYQPQENDENRQHSLLALPNSRPYRVLGRSGETAYSHLTTPPRRNNIATGAESNAGLDAVANSTATSTATSTTTSTFRPSSVLGGPIGAGAFGGKASNPPASSTAPTSSSVTSTSALPRGISSAKASLLTPSQPPIGGGGRTDPTITVVVNNPKHPDYRDLDARINSFQGWPDYLDQTARQMAEAGFFFVGVADFTRCFCCGGGLRNWEPGDDPMLEHTRWFPRCEYVNKLKGERYVAAVQRRHQEHMAEQQRQQQELAQRRDANRNPPDPMNTEAAAVLREMGYQQERIRDAILAVRQQIGVPDVTTQQVLAWLLDQHEGRSPPTSDRTSPTRDLGVKVNIVVTPSTTQTSTPSTVINTTASVSTATSTVLTGSTSTLTVSSTSTTSGAESQQSGSSTYTTGSTGAGSKPASQTGSSVNEAREGSSVDKQSAATRGESDEEEFKSAEETPSPDVKSSGKKKSKKKTKTKGGSKSTGASGGPVDAKSLKEENEKLREMQTCKICMERPVNTTLLPCGHLVCCDICAGRLNRCPICRKRIQGTVKTFMS